MDVVCWLVAIFVLWFYRLVGDKTFVYEYVGTLLLMMVGWLLIGAIGGRYKSITREMTFKRRVITLFILLLVYALVMSLLVINYTNMSGDTFFWAIAIVGICALIGDFLVFAYRYAQDQGTPEVIASVREKQELAVRKEMRNDVDVATMEMALKECVGKEAAEVLKRYVDIRMNTTRLMNSSDAFNFRTLGANRYDTIVNLRSLNTIKGINKMFCAVNEVLPDEGRWCCRFVSQDVIKKEIMERHAKGVNRIVYAAYFIYRRILPRLTFTHRLYFDYTGGKKRSLSKTEVLGRLYFCGFSVDEEIQIGRETYVFSHRMRQPEPQYPRRWYGPLITLPRIGKNYEVIHVYKMRTMHPYSEYLQQYIYDKYGLQKGGKFDHDPRVSSLGRWMRKCWIDELPMILNMLRGELKLVGVRPLSRQYFSLYPADLQDLRTKFKPGLIPPFYVDMPSTTDEIFESERRYLMSYERNPIWTDVKYFFEAIWTIVFRRARSN